jgi:hypothetical protein
LALDPITEVTHVVKWKETILEKRRKNSSRKRKKGKSKMGKVK